MNEQCIYGIANIVNSGMLAKAQGLLADMDDANVATLNRKLNTTSSAEVSDHTGESSLGMTSIIKFKTSEQY